MVLPCALYFILQMNTVICRVHFSGVSPRGDSDSDADGSPGGDDATVGGDVSVADCDAVKVAGCLAVGGNVKVADCVDVHLTTCPARRQTLP